MYPRLSDPSQIMRYVEPAATVATGLASEIGAGWGGLVSMNPSNVEAIHHAGTYMPRTAAGREGLADLSEFLSGAGEYIMDTPYLGTGIRYFGESADRLGAVSPVAGAALRTAPAAVALLYGGEASRAFGNVGRGMQANMRAARPGPIARQSGYIKPAVFAGLKTGSFRFSKAAKGASTGLVAERTAQRIGKGLESTHKAYTAEKTAESSSKDNGHGGRNLLAH